MNRGGGCNSFDPLYCHPLHLPASERHGMRAASPFSDGGGSGTRRPDDIRRPEAAGDAIRAHGALPTGRPRGLIIAPGYERFSCPG
jgi:hypothetical protein